MNMNEIIEPVSLKYGYFAVYKGKEYPIMPYGNGCTLHGEEEDLKLGFEKSVVEGYNYVSYDKFVSYEEVELAYEIRLFGKYKGCKVHIPHIFYGRDTVTIEMPNTIDNDNTADDHGFSYVYEDEYWKKENVPLSELSPILGEVIPFEEFRLK